MLHKPMSLHVQDCSRGISSQQILCQVIAETKINRNCVCAVVRVCLCTSAVVGVILLVLHFFKASGSDFIRFLQPHRLDMLGIRLNRFVIFFAAFFHAVLAHTSQCLTAENPAHCSRHDHGKWCVPHNQWNATEKMFSGRGGIFRNTHGD